MYTKEAEFSDSKAALLVTSVNTQQSVSCQIKRPTAFRQTHKEMVRNIRHGVETESESFITRVMQGVMQ